MLTGFGAEAQLGLVAAGLGGEAIYAQPLSPAGPRKLIGAFKLFWLVPQCGPSDLLGQRWGNSMQGLSGGRSTARRDKSESCSTVRLLFCRVQVLCRPKN